MLLDIYQDESKDLETGKELKTVNLSLIHNKDNKKLLVSIHPIKLTKNNGYTAKEFMMFEEFNYSSYMIDLPRASDKKYKQAIDYIKANLDKIWELYNRGENPNKAEINKLLWGFKFS